MRSFSRLAVLAGAASFVACRPDPDPTDDETLPSFDVADAPEAERAECARAIDRAAIECSASFDVTIVDFDEEPDQPVLDVIDLASVATSFPDGLYVPVSPALPASPTVGRVLADNGACQVLCTIPCDVSRNDFCAAQTKGSTCSFCGPPATLEQCEAFVAACE